MNDLPRSAENTAKKRRSRKPARKSKLVYTVLALLPTGFFGIAEFYIGRKLLGVIICAATILVPAESPDTDTESGDSQVQEQQTAPKSMTEELIDFLPVMLAVLYVSSFVTGFWYIRNNCEE